MQRTCQQVIEGEIRQSIQSADNAKNKKLYKRWRTIAHDVKTLFECHNIIVEKQYRVQQKACVVPHRAR